ncbi:hypothetical protein PKOR_06775 [Pontibacter korlensis]|uniref:Uncharacterized protein n=1 Tax=Pontibacter korlensis TaxID=400092 RepID=A0A0E3UVX9_9BACT|nr:hypothetical protein PKOR_06775 [Pontibacter korlensis]
MGFILKPKQLQIPLLSQVIDPELVSREGHGWSDPALQIFTGFGKIKKSCASITHTALSFSH